MSELLRVDRIACMDEISSKKRALETLSSLLVKGNMGVNTQGILGRLLERERLGSTGLGAGVAIPHGRIEGMSQPQGALLILRAGLAFDNVVDDQPVDIVMGLLFPEDTSECHLSVLSRVAETFSDVGLCSQIRSASSPDAVYRLIARTPLNQVPDIEAQGVKDI